MLKSAVRQALPVVLALAAALLVWELVVRYSGVPAYLVPAPESVWQAVWNDREALATHLASTLRIALIGFTLGVLLGIAVAMVLGVVDPLRRAVEPLLIASQAVPAVIIAPLLIAVMGFGMVPKLIVVTLGSFFPVAVSATLAIRDAPPTLIDLLHSMGAGRWVVLRRVRLPGAIPGVVSGAKVAASYVIFGAIVAEWMGSSVGLGVYLQRSQASYQMHQMYGAVGVIALLGVLLFWSVSLIGNAVLSRHRFTLDRKVTTS